MSPEEKAAIEGRARSAGLRLSDFVRGAALGQASVGEARQEAAGTVDPGLVPAAPSAAPAVASRREHGFDPDPPRRERKSIVPEGAPITELPKIAKRWWADDG